MAKKDKDRGHAAEKAKSRKKADEGSGKLNEVFFNKISKAKKEIRDKKDKSRLSRGKSFTLGQLVPIEVS